MRCRWCELEMQPDMAPDGSPGGYRCWTPFCGGCMCPSNQNFMRKLREAIDGNDEKLLAGMRSKFTDEQWGELVAH